MKLRVLAGFLLIVVGLLGTASAIASAQSATPPLHPQAAPISTTEARFQWVPGQENRYFCLDYARSASDLINLTGTWRNSGCGTTSNSHVVSSLACGTKYFARVWTSAAGGLYSSIVTVETLSCARAISAPTGLAVVFATRSTARLDWDAGTDNRWFCIDTAKSRAELLNFGGNWHNHACWSTSTQITIGGLACETTYYWRVFVWNPITRIHSDVSTFRTASCETTLVEAPIEAVDVDKVGGEYVARIVVGRPDTCHSFGSYAAEASGNVIEVTVYNKVAPNSCAQVSSTYTLTLNLGSGFFSGVTYVVVVNDTEVAYFTAS